MFISAQSRYCKDTLCTSASVTKLCPVKYKFDKCEVNDTCELRQLNEHTSEVNANITATIRVQSSTLECPGENNKVVVVKESVKISKEKKAKNKTTCEADSVAVVTKKKRNSKVNETLVDPNADAVTPEAKLVSKKKSFADLFAKKITIPSSVVTQKD